MKILRNLIADEKETSVKLEIVYKNKVLGGTSEIFSPAFGSVAAIPRQKIHEG